MKNILVAMPFHDAHKAYIEKIGAGCEFHYTTIKTATAEEVKAADIIFGNISPELVKQNDHLEWMQLNSAGSDQYCKPGVIGPDTILTCAAIVQSFMLIITMPLGGITSGTQTILGYNYGAKRPDRIWKAERWIVTCALLFNTVMFLAAQCIPEIFVRIFTRNEEYVALSAWAIRMSTLGVIPLAVQYTVVDGFTGMGIAKVAITLSLFRKSIYFLSVVLIPLLTGVTNVFFAETVSDFAGPVFSIILFLLVFKKVVGDPKQISAA